MTYLFGPDGSRWPDYTWPGLASGIARKWRWEGLQNMARIHAAEKPGARVVVYAYLDADGRWAYTIGDDLCRACAYRPGVREREVDRG